MQLRTLFITFLIIFIFQTLSLQAENASVLTSENFDLYYSSTTSKNYAEKALKYFEESLKKYEKFGFKMPKDSPHIYKKRKVKVILVSSIATVTEGPHKGVVPHGLVTDDPEYGVRVELINNITDEKWFKSVIPHETFHLIQRLYDAWEDATLQEATAVAMEDEVFPEAYSYTTRVQEFFEHWKKGESLISKTGNLEYAGSIFFKFLMEKGLDYETKKPLGATYLKRLWDAAAFKKGPDDLGVLIRRSLPINNDYNDLLLQFAAALYVKHDKDLPELSFKRGKELLYNLGPSKKIDTLKSNFFDSVLQYGARYYEYYWPGTGGAIKKPYHIKIEVPKFAEKNPYQGTLRFGLLTIEVGTGKKKFTTYKPKTSPFKSISITTPPIGIDPETKTGIYKFILIVANTSKNGQDISVSASVDQ